MPDAAAPRELHPDPAPPLPPAIQGVQRPALWALFAMAAIAVPAAAYFMNPPSKLPVIARLPEFQLTDQEGRSFSRSDLDGKVWVADFVFTSCSGICPLLTARMKTLQDHLARDGRLGQVKLLSLTVDPANDTPAKLKEYAKRFNADPAAWHFVTGASEPVQKAIVEGFHMAMGKVPTKENPVDANDFEIVHGQKFVLVDRQGQIRAYYDVEEAEGLERLEQDLAPLARGR